MKIWRGKDNNDDKIIAIDNGIIYKGNPKDEDIESCISELKKGNIPGQGFTGMPIHYLQEIRYQEGKKYIELVMAEDSEEHLKIHDELLKEEVFGYFKQHIPGAIFESEHYSKVKAGRKPLLALAVITGLFLWALPYAIGYDTGMEYDIVNGNYGSLTGIILALASLGVMNVSLIYGSFAVIALLSFYFKTKKPPIINRLRLRK